MDRGVVRGRSQLGAISRWSTVGAALFAIGVSACGKERPFGEAAMTSDPTAQTGAGGAQQPPGALGATEVCAAPPCASNPEQVPPLGGISRPAGDGQDNLAGTSAGAADAGSLACSDGAIAVSIAANSESSSPFGQPARRMSLMSARASSATG